MAQYSFRLKVDRALVHAEALDRDIRGWIEREPNPFVVERKADSQGPILEFRFRQGVMVDPKWSLVIGDCVHNLRSALDHLVFELGSSYSIALTLQQAKKSEFPIFGPRAMTTKEAADALGCIDPLAQAVIKGLQPHESPPHDKHPLWLIQDLDNVDKHRLVNAIVAVSSGISIDSTVDVRDMEINGGSADSDAPVLIVSYYEDQEVNTNFELPIHIAFSDGPAAGMPVVDTVRRLHDYVRTSVIDPLSKFL